MFEKVTGFSEIAKQIAEQRAKELDRRLRDSVEGSTITFFDVVFQEWDEGHPDYMKRSQTIVRIATDGAPVEEPLIGGGKAIHQTNRFKWKISSLPWDENDEAEVKLYTDFKLKKDDVLQSSNQR